jgi:protease-4
MSIDAETIADRRKLRRKLSFWRVIGILALIAAVVTAGFAMTDRSTVGVAQSHIARVSVDGIIAGSERTTDLLKRVGEARSVSGVVISINSPGGTTTGSEELYRNIRDLARKKPLVAFVDGTAASGGYITALAADRIVARETSLVGSIGVLFQFPDLSGLLGNVGVKMEEIKSAPLKAEPSPFRPASPEARAALQQVVNDTYDWFKRLVRERRGLTDAELAAVSTGQVFSGRQGIPLEREKGVRQDLPVRDWKPRGDRDFSLFSWAAFSADLVGFDGLARALRQAAASADAAQLDGLLAVWHPAAEK